MTTVDLHQPILDGVRRTAFFNGRVLTAEDLRDEQAATLARARAAARAAGPGIVAGLRVRPGGGGERAAVTVTPGIAVDPLGDVLEIRGDVVVRLVAEPPEQERPAAGSPFVACQPRRFEQSGAGTYLLVASPAEGDAGRTPRVGFGDGGVAGECGPRWTAEGLRFHLVPIEPASLATAAGLPGDVVDPHDRSIVGRSRLRNVLAHALLGTGGALDRIRDPLRTGDPEGLAILREQGLLGDCDVPLCLLGWTGEATLDFLDEWSVRRPPTPADAPLGAIETMLGGRRQVAGTATLLQFAEHLDDILAVGTRPLVDVLRPPFGVGPPERFAPPRERMLGRPSRAPHIPISARIADVLRTSGGLVAREHFRWLPPAGVLPVRERGGDRGVNPDTFFSGMTVAPPVHIPGARLEKLLRDAAAYPPIDTTSGEAVWQYLVAENRLARDRGESVAPVLVFASGHLPYLGDAQYDLGRFDVANRARTPERS